MLGLRLLGTHNSSKIVWQKLRPRCSARVSSLTLFPWGTARYPVFLVHFYKNLVTLIRCFQTSGPWKLWDIKRNRLGRCFPAQLTGLCLCRMAALQEAEDRQVAGAPKHLLAASMGTSHKKAHGGGFLSHSHMLVCTGRLCQEAGLMASLFSLPGAAHSFLALLAQVPATCLQGSETLHVPLTVIRASSYSVRYTAIHLGSVLYVDRPPWPTLFGIFLVGDTNSGHLNCLYYASEAKVETSVFPPPGLSQ